MTAIAATRRQLFRPLGTLRRAGLMLALLAASVLLTRPPHNFDYEAFGGTLGAGVNSTNHLFAGESFDQDYSAYFLRARNYAQELGIFQSRDAFPGFKESPDTLNLYKYTSNNPANRTDPSGHYYNYAAVAISLAVVSTLLFNATVGYFAANHSSATSVLPDAGIVSVRPLGIHGMGGIGLLGADVVWHHGKVWWAIVGEYGLDPLSIFATQRGGAWSASFGAIWGLQNIQQLEGDGFNSSYPISAINLMPRSLLPSFAWGFMSQVAKLAKTPKWRHWTINLGLSTSGPVSVTFGPRQSSFTGTISYTRPYRVLFDPADLLSLVGTNSGAQVSGFLTGVPSPEAIASALGGQ